MSERIEAGREMDALIAERVMGLVWDESRCRVCGWPLAATTDAGCTADNCCMRPPSHLRRADDPPPYSTDIAAAWQLVEAMRARGLHFCLNAVRTDDGVSQAYAKVVGGADWCCWFERETEKLALTVDATAPLAICRAALAATAVE